MRYNGGMKKPPSLRPACSRMEQRAAACLKLPAEQQTLHYYFNGDSKADFCASVAAGHPHALALALDILAAEHWLQPRDSTRYARGIRAALRTAGAAQLLAPAQQKIHFAIEWRHLVRLSLRAYVSSCSDFSTAQSNRPTPPRTGHPLHHLPLYCKKLCAMGSLPPLLPSN